MQCIVVSYAKNEALQEMTQRAIDSAGVPVIVVEQNDEVNYINANTLHYNFKFNYNKCLKLGLAFCNSKYVALCNNDLIFHKDWDKKLITVLERGFDTVCPYCPRTHKERKRDKGNYIYVGYQMGYEFVGWCIAGKTELFKEIGLNEKIEFWYSDNFLAKQLQKEKKRHALVCNSFVEHIDAGSITLKQVNASLMRELTLKQKRIYEKEVKKLYAQGN